MAVSRPITLVLKARKGAIGSLVIETTISETYSFSSTATKFPIEDGSMVSDHIVLDPEKIKITGFISNTPLDADPDNYAQQAFEQLYTMWQAKELVDVDTKYVVYTDMCITSVSVPRTVQTGQAIQFDVELQKIRKVNSSATNVDKFQPDYLEKAPITVSLGDLAGVVVDALPIPKKAKDTIKGWGTKITDFLRRAVTQP